MKKITAAPFIVAGLIVTSWFAACHSFSTQQGNIDSNRVTGLIYYLPKGKVRITGDFKSGGGDSGATTAAKSAAPGGAQFATAAADGPSGGGSAEQKNFVVTIAANIEADPDARYYLKPVRNYFYDDDIKLTVNAKHLLSTGNATAEDQTAQIISTAASIAATGFGIPSAGPPTPLAPENKGVPPTAPPTINLGELLREIEKAIGENTVNLDAKIEVSPEALGQLNKALPWIGSPYQDEIEKILDRLQTENKTWFTPKDIFNLLRLLPPEKLKEPINVEPRELRTLFRKLRIELRVRKWVQPRPFSIVFDPERAQPDLREYGFTVTVKEEPQPEMKLLRGIWEGEKQDLAHGIVFRAVKPYRVTIQSVRGTWFYIRENRLVLLPDTCPHHTLVLDYSRLAFVKKTTNIGFVDGVPQNLAQKAPSSVLGFLAIPKGIIQAIVPLPPAVTGPPGGVQGPGTSGTTGAPQAAPQSPSPGG